MNSIISFYRRRYDSLNIEDRVLFIFPFFTTLFVGCFIPLRWLNEQYGLMIINIISVSIMIMVHFLMLFRRVKYARILFIGFMGTIMILIVYQYHDRQLNWIYPGTAMLFFSMRPNSAFIYTNSIITAIGALLWSQLDFSSWLQSIITLYTIIFIVYIFSYSFYRKNERLTKLAIASDRAATIDTLTSLPNRRSFDTYSDLIMTKHIATGMPASMIIIDIDHFKRVNDSYGHTNGDYVLKKTASILQASLRENENIYRIGGEEFAVITVNTTQNEAIACAERLRVAVENTHYEEISEYHCTVSIGVSSCYGNDVRDWYRQADEALYKAKHRGRNQTAGLE